MMSSYKISRHSFRQAKKLGVVIRVSKIPSKKIDVFDKDGRILLASIGNIKYNDYTTYLKQNKKLAEERRRLYKIRHEKYRHVVGSPAYYADQILW